MRNSTCMLVVLATMLAPAVLAPAAPDEKPAEDKVENRQGVFLFEGIRHGQEQGQPYVSLAVRPVEGGAGGEMLLADKVAATVMDLLRTHPRTGLLAVEYALDGDSATALSVKRYQIVWGEDEPAVFIFVKKDKVKMGSRELLGVTVKKFLQQYTLLVPNKRNAQGVEEADEALVRAIEGAKDGDLVEVQGEKSGETLWLRGFKRLEPYRKAEFVRAVRDKVGTQDLPGVELKEEGKEQALRFSLDAKGEDFAAMGQVIAGCRMGSEVLIRTRSGDPASWLVSIRRAHFQAPDPARTPRFVGMRWIRPPRARPGGRSRPGR